jgi:hypothetical protein
LRKHTANLHKFITTGRGGLATDFSEKFYILPKTRQIDVKTFQIIHNVRERKRERQGVGVPDVLPKTSQPANDNDNGTGTYVRFMF